MDTEAFWGVLDVAKDRDEPLDVALTAHLATRPADEILAFEDRFARLRDTVCRWDVWAAAYLIGGGCSDDRFSDFTAGLVALGREWYDRTAACADALADHPAVRVAAATGDDEVVFYEAFNFVSVGAYGQLTGNEEDFWDAWDAHSRHLSSADKDGAANMGEPFDFDDAQQMRQRLPRLAALYLGTEAA
ncbi:DUF4240 domain-containing protein [Streptomyces sp. NPDC003483]